MYHVPSSQHAVGRRHASSCRPRKPRHFTRPSSASRCSGTRASRASYSVKREREVLHALAEVASQRERWHERRATRRARVERLVGRHESAAPRVRPRRPGRRPRRTTDGRVEGRELVERRPQQRQPRERERAVVRVALPPRVAVESGGWPARRHLRPRPPRDGVGADQRQQQRRAHGSVSATDFQRDAARHAGAAGPLRPAACRPGRRACRAATRSPKHILGRRHVVGRAVGARRAGASWMRRPGTGQAVARAPRGGPPSGRRARPGAASGRTASAASYVVQRPLEAAIAALGSRRASAAAMRAGHGSTDDRCAGGAAAAPPAQRHQTTACPSILHARRSRRPEVDRSRGRGR